MKRRTQQKWCSGCCTHWCSLPATTGAASWLMNLGCRVGGEGGQARIAGGWVRSRGVARPHLYCDLQGSLSPQPGTGTNLVLPGSLLPLAPRRSRGSLSSTASRGSCLCVAEVTAVGVGALCNINGLPGVCRVPWNRGAVQSQKSLCFECLLKSPITQLHSQPPPALRVLRRMFHQVSIVLTANGPKLRLSGWAASASVLRRCAGEDL